MTGTFRPGLRLSCLALLVALPLSACAAGYQAETSRVRTTLTSVSGAKGDLTLRNMFVVGPARAGGAVGFYAAIFNGGPATDHLVSISSSDTVRGILPANTAIPGGGSLFYNLGDRDVPVLTGLKNDLLVGQEVNVTMTFALAGELTVTVPVENSDGMPAPALLATPTPNPTPSRSVNPSPSGSASPSVKRPTAGPTSSPAAP